MTIEPTLPQMTTKRLRRRRGRSPGRAGVITPRDWLVATHLYNCDVMGTAQIARAVFHDGYDSVARQVIPGANPEGSLSAAQRRLYKLREKAFVEPESQPGFPVGYTTLWRLTPQTFAALREPGSRHKLPRPMSPANTLHHLAVTELYARLVGRLHRGGFSPDLNWSSERQGPVREYRKNGGGAGAEASLGRIKPDATIRIGSELYFLEVQRAASREPAERLARRVGAYASYLSQAPDDERDAAILFACETERDADAIYRARDSHPGLYLVAGTTSEIEDLLYDEALSNSASQRDIAGPNVAEENYPGFAGGHLQGAGHERGTT